MAEKTLDARIDEVSQNLIGVQMALLTARNTLGDETVVRFLDKVPEQGEALWLRFRAFRDARSGMTFLHFIAWVLQGCPN